MSCLVKLDSPIAVVASLELSAEMIGPIIRLLFVKALVDSGRAGRASQFRSGNPIRDNARLRLRRRELNIKCRTGSPNNHRHCRVALVALVLHKVLGAPPNGGCTGDRAKPLGDPREHRTARRTTRSVPPA